MFIAIDICVSARGQKIINVPSDMATIQAGVDESSDGDTVLVAPGVHLEHIDFKGNAISVKGNGSGVILNGGGGFGPVVTFKSRETRSSILDSLTVRNGSPVASQDAGGIFLSSSSPTIRDSDIRNSKGCGIGVFNGAPSIQNNNISSNIATPSFLCLAPSTDLAGQLGDGVVVFGASSDGLQPEISGNTIDSNVAIHGGAGITAYDAGQLSIENNTITQNLSAPSWVKNEHFDIQAKLDDD